MTTENELHEIENGLVDIIDGAISATDFAEQIRRFETGYSPTVLERACVLGDGIYKITDGEHDGLLGIFEETSAAGRFSKFVPASGSATRMFKHLLAALRAEEVEKLDTSDAKLLKEFMDCLKSFPFYSELKDAMAQDGLDLERSRSEGRVKDILEYLLTDKGLGYSALPKGLIPFHSYSDGLRTPFEEHLAEAVEYARSGKNRVKLHFTVTPQFRDRISEHLEAATHKFPDYKFDISLSEQSRKTDTVAVDMNNKVFRTEDNKILFRPAGHGALLDNLQKTGGDIVYLKNIDNIMPKSRVANTLEYKKLLGGKLVELQDEVFECINMLENHNFSEFEVAVVGLFAVSKLNVHLPEDFSTMETADQASLLLSFLTKPIRVCGMVKNEGEPGGGPFWVMGPDGYCVPQIVEKSQVDIDDDQQAQIMAGSTHFNPVDIVCGLRNHRGERFDLQKHVDIETGFIAYKSKEGRPLKGLELPGLWNGSMADWITLFVEVPLSTFSPVKTVNDLLKSQHQS